MNATNALIVFQSYHHGNTETIAKAIANDLSIRLYRFDEVPEEAIAGSDWIGFGAGIDSGHHYQGLLDFAAKLPNGSGKKAFLFSTCGLYTKTKMETDHQALRTILGSKGFDIVGEFACLGYNTNSFLKYFGGINKGHPNAVDIARAITYARNSMS
jgi:flavodoxin